MHLPSVIQDRIIQEMNGIEPPHVGKIILQIELHYKHGLASFSVEAARRFSQSVAPK